MKPEQERVKDLITDTVLLLCKNGLSYIDELKIEGVIGVTLDNKDLFLVHVNERLQHDNDITNDKSQPDEMGSKVAGDTQQSLDRYNCSSNIADDISPCLTQDADAYLYAVEEDGVDVTSPAVIKIEDDDEGRDSSICQPPAGQTTINPYTRRQQQNYNNRRPLPPQRPRPGASRPAARRADDPGDDFYEPAAKRTAQQDGTGLGLHLNSSLDPGSWAQLGEFASQAAVAAAAAALELPGDGRLQAPPGCSSWTPVSSKGLSDSGSSSAPTEAKYPSHALQSHNIKEALAFGVVDPLLEASPNAKIMTFRLSWFGSDSAHLDKVWQNIVMLQEQMDQFIGGAAGAKVVISAYTGTLSGRATKTDTPGVRMSYPGLAYWVLSEREQLDERLFMRQLHEHAHGARIKSLLYEYEQNKDKITNALFVVVKDCTGGFVRRKVDESVSLCADRGRPDRQQPALVRLWVKDNTYWDQMLAAQARLKSACCDVSLHQL